MLLILYNTLVSVTELFAKDRKYDDLLPYLGRLKMHDLKMQDWKMTDNFARNRRVWKMQDWKMKDHVN